METINHECYVSLEVAKLLRKAGFDWGCRGYYDRQILRFNFVWNHNGKGASTQCSAPTLTVAQKWLRKVKNYEVFVCPCKHIGEIMYFYNIYKYDENNIIEIPCDGYFDTYEKAQEAGNKKTLEIILEEGE